jgi:hypothetical protein
MAEKNKRIEKKAGQPHQNAVALKLSSSSYYERTLSDSACFLKRICKSAQNEWI